MNTSTSAGRRLLLGRRRGVERLRGNGEGAEFDRELRSVEAIACSRPEERCEFEQAILGSHGHQPNEASQVLLGVEPVQTRGGDDGEQRGSALGVVIAAAEKPCLASRRNRLQRALGAVVRTSRPSSKKRVSASF